MKMKPATLVALLDGDIENALISATPGGIEAQEAQGQKDFVADESLPIRCNYSCTRKQLEQMGIVFGKEIDDLFIEAKLPEGWQKISTDHSMWSKLVDERGRERAMIFYKAAFYDRRAEITLSKRFSIDVIPVCGYEDPDYKSHEWHCIVTDADEIAWTSEERVEPEPKYDNSDETTRQQWLDWDDRKSQLRNLGETWLNENYPEWEDPLAYWD